MSSRWAGATALLVAGLVLGAPALAAHAEDPVELGGAYVLDTVGVVTGDESRIIDALDDLYSEANIQLFVVYVSTFTGADDAVDWADRTAILNSLGVDDVLLAVAVDDRQYALSVDQDFPLSDAQLTEAESAIENELRNDQWADAAIAGAESMAASARGGVAPVDPGGPVTPNDPSTPTTEGGGIPILPIVGGVAVVGGGIFLFSRLRKRSKEGRVTAQPDQMSQKQLDQRAGSLLVQLDDSLKTSEQELGFAVAQFGEAATKDFALTLASAKQKVAQAFQVKQKLDDAHPDTEADTRAWTTEIITLCEAADAELDAQADAFDALRELEKNAPAALATIVEQTAAARTRAAAAAATLTTLQSTYAAKALASVAENPAQAAKLLDFAEAAAEAAEKAIAGGTPSEAAIAVRTAQASVGQAAQLFDAIDLLDTNLAEATTALTAAITDTTNDVAAAKALPSDPSLTPAIAAASAALAAATKATDDPVAALTSLQTANASLEQVFTGVRDQQQAVAKAASQLDGAITGARAQLTSTMEFITTRRGGIGESARTRLAEAQRRLDQAVALSTSDPVAALEEARQANQLGLSAFQLAESDVRVAASRENYNSPSWSRGSDGADLGGLLGGIVGGLISGGGSSRSGWSGGGSSGGFGGFSGGSRSTRSGSFGGSSRSSRSSRGSSGGGRSRGGRF
jgi:uncharacterized membrane protein YgcG